MSHDLQLVLASGLLTGGFALAAAFTVHALTARREARKFRIETASQLPEVERLMWGDSWTDLQIALRQIEIALAVARVDANIVRCLLRITRAAWHDRREEVERSAEGGIAVALLDAREVVVRAVIGELLDDQSQPESRRLRSEAVRAVNDALAGWDDPEWP
jgi:hypothetical protein